MAIDRNVLAYKLLTYTHLTILLPAIRTIYIHPSFSAKPLTQQIVHISLDKYQVVVYHNDCNELRGRRWRVTTLFSMQERL